MLCHTTIQPPSPSPVTAWLSTCREVEAAAMICVPAPKGVPSAAKRCV